MIAHSLLSGALLLLPIAVTVGVYMGVEFQKIFHGGFSGTYGVLQPGTGSGSTSPDPTDGVQTYRYCAKSIGITPRGSRFTYNPNQWSLTASDVSRMCMNLTTGTVKKGEYITDPFSVTWNYTQGPDTQPVHAFANAQLSESSLPAAISTINSVPVHVEWNYGIGNDNTTSDTIANLVSADVNANVAFDLFFDAGKTESTVNTKADHEVMVWLGKFGAATEPIGYGKGSLSTKSVNGTLFNLYTGDNSQGQHVWTWVAATEVTTFAGDILPLITMLEENNGPTASDYLGYMAFGTEAYWSPQNVTFSVTQCSMEIVI